MKKLKSKDRFLIKSARDGFLNKSARDRYLYKFARETPCKLIRDIMIAAIYFEIDWLHELEQHAIKIDKVYKKIKIKIKL